MKDRRFAMIAALAALTLVGSVILGSTASAGTVDRILLAQAAGDPAEIAFWDSIKDSKNPDEYKAYLDTYPKGKFAALARVRMNALKGGQAPAASGSSSSSSSSSDLPKLPGQGGASSGSAASAPPPAPAAAAPAPAAAPAASAEPSFKYWTAAKPRVAIYPEPSARSSFIRDEYYVMEQAIKVVEEIPGRRKLPWLKVITPGGKTGYVFSGEARPSGVSASGKPVQSPGVED